MTTRRWFATSSFYGVLLAIAWLCPRPAHAAPVTEKEAIETAEFWYPAEVNFYEQKGWKRQRSESKAELLAATKVARVRYLIDSGAVVEKLKGNQYALAYIVDFSPRGHVVISADDRVSPFLIQNIDYGFDETQNPEGPVEGDCHSFAALYLENYARSINRYLYLDNENSSNIETNSGWTNLRSMISSQKNEPLENKTFTIPDTEVKSLAVGTPNPDQTAVLLPTVDWYYQYIPYNDELQYDDILIWAGSGAPPSPTWKQNVPTGCNANALAMILRYHEWPVRIRGYFEWTDIQDDVWGSGALDDSITFSWDTMPNAPLTAPNQDVANLMYYAGIIDQTNWEVNKSAANQNIEAINENLGYRGTRWVDPYDDNPAECPQANCKYFKYGGFEYYLCPNTYSWATAHMLCNDAGMDLLWIYDEYENGEVFNQIQSSSSKDLQVWIGADDLPLPPGNWHWEDWGNPSYQFWQGDENGSCVVDPTTSPPRCYYNNWYQGEPDGDHDCAAIGGINSAGKWSANDCNDPKPYICKRQVQTDRIFDDIVYSIVRGLPVLISVNSYHCGHSTIAHGYCEHCGPGSDPAFAEWNQNWYTLIDYPGCTPGIVTGAGIAMAPDNYVYVDPFCTYGCEFNDGSPEYPVGNITRGISLIPAVTADNPKGGILWLKASNYYISNLTIDKPMKILSYLGTATIANKITLSPDGEIKIGNGGALTIY